MDKRILTPTDETVIRAAITAPNRLRALRRTNLLDTPPEESFDRITRLAAKLIGAPATFIALVDQNRDFYKSAYGVGEPLASERQIEGRTFCHYAILSTDALVLNDVTQIPHFREVPTVQSLGVRAYVGIPLVTGDNSIIGSFCAIDYRPRTWSQMEVDILRDLAHSAMREIDLRLAAQEMRSVNADLLEQAEMAAILNAEMRAAQRVSGAIMDSAPYCVISMDTNGVIRMFNKAAERMLQYRADEMVGKTPDQLHDSDEIILHAHTVSEEVGYWVPAGVRTLLAKAQAGLQDDREWTYIRKDGSRFPVRLVVTSIQQEGPNGGIIGYLGIAYDISEANRATEYSQHIASHDTLTGLPNRSLLTDRLTMTIAQHQRSKCGFSVAMIDVDHFKRLNDTMGRDVGDKLLKAVSVCLTSCLRATDTVARVGGDEFVVLLPGNNAQGVRVIAERIADALEAPMTVMMKTVQTSVSMGFSSYPDHGQSEKDLLRCAGMAINLVKNQGRKGYKIYNRGMDPAINC